jgi:hypothetical protein
VPWIEAAQDKPFPGTFVEKMEGHRRNRPPGKKLLLSISPLDLGRKTLAELGNATGQQPLPTDWGAQRFNDPIVKQAYLNYVRWMAEFFRPDYLFAGIESNELLNNQPAEWKNYLELSRFVRSEIKKLYPALPVAESITLHKLLEAGTTLGRISTNSGKPFPKQ